MSIINLARYYFSEQPQTPTAIQQQQLAKTQQGKQQQQQQENEKNSEEQAVDLTPLLDKTQIAADEFEVVIPESWLDELAVNTEEDAELFKSGLQKLGLLHALLKSLVERKSWTINQLSLPLLTKLDREVSTRKNETIKVLVTITDTEQNHYVFWVVNPSVIEGQFSCNIQEQTYDSSCSLTNTSVFAMKYNDKNKDKPANLDLAPIVDEFAKVDKTIQKEFAALEESYEEAAPSSEKEEEDFWALEDETIDEETSGAEEEVAEESEEVEESEPKNFSRKLRKIFSL